MDDATGFTQEQLDQLGEQHGDVGHLKSRTPGRWEIALRPPNRMEVRMFRSSINNPAKRPDAQEVLVTQCCVATYYDGVATMEQKEARKVLTKMLDRWPAICDSEASTNVMQRLMSDAVEGEGKS
jgi:hypothetical protein